MFQFKRITSESVPRALAKAERYRLLNEPEEAESICEDILVLEPEHQQTLITLLLAVTDTFHHGSADALGRSRALLVRLKEAYDRAYYEGIICERWAKAQYNPQRANPFVYNGLREAMGLYEKAEALRPPENDDAVLRWNACARFIEINAQLKADVDHVSVEASFKDELPTR